MSRRCCRCRCLYPSPLVLAVQSAVLRCRRKLQAQRVALLWPPATNALNSIHIHRHNLQRTRFERCNQDAFKFTCQLHVWQLMNIRQKAGEKAQITASGSSCVNSCPNCARLFASGLLRDRLHAFGTSQVQKNNDTACDTSSRALCGKNCKTSARG